MNRLFARYIIAPLALYAILLFFAIPTFAVGNGGIRTVDNLPPIYVYHGFQIPAGTEASFRTFELSLGSDTVLHVQSADDANGGSYVAGNDDCSGTSSCVTIPPANSDRRVDIVVRAFSEETGGTARLEASINGSVVLQSQLFPFGVKFVDIGPMAEGGHLFTNRNPAASHRYRHLGHLGTHAAGRRGGL